MSAPSTSSRQGRLLLGGIGVCAVAIVGAARLFTAHEQVLFVNALDTSVTVTAGGEQFSLVANEHRVLKMPIGPMDVDVRSEAATLAHETVFVTDEGGLFVYNVLGAAPLFMTTVRYERDDAPVSSSEPSTLVVAGTPFLRVGRIDYVLTDPPQRIEMRKEDGQYTTRLHLGQAPGGWASSYGWLMTNHQPAKAARLSEAILRALPETPGVENAAFVSRMVLAREEGLLASLAITRAERDAHPDNADAQRTWMRDMRRAGRNEEVRAYYQAELERHPDSLVMAVLLARVEPEPGGTARLEALVRSHPGELLPRRALAVRYARQQRWADALPLLDAMEQGDPDYARYQETHAEVLVALGRRAEAARRLSERLLQAGAENEPPELADVQLYAKLVGHASQDGQENAAMRQLIAWAQKDRPEGQVARWLAASLGQAPEADESRTPPDDSVATAVRVMLALAEEPEFAARAAAHVDFLTFRHVGTEAGMLLAAEFERLGDAALAARTLDVSGVELDYGELQDVLSGKLPVESLTTLDWGERAALHLVLARQLDARGGDSKAAYARVKKELLLPGAVTIALQKWDRPKPSGAVAGDTVP
ncbi:tetratricopeptide repeat protein [Corallococcus exercitus]|uniref:Tetratricopeptide repeat protein n=1 Tax=Corallococcus exercitus TaxID=2316736 RepID=A0A7Y4NFE0_9BACT|nr:hypothetical protein [Corallococcus exercitus]NOK11889.1 hypothetical protein [Corallococcus exercitus]